jgi:hypothetical protein
VSRPGVQTAQPKLGAFDWPACCNTDSQQRPAFACISRSQSSLQIHTPHSCPYAALVVFFPFSFLPTCSLVLSPLLPPPPLPPPLQTPPTHLVRMAAVSLDCSSPPNMGRHLYLRRSLGSATIVCSERRFRDGSLASGHGPICCTSSWLASKQKLRAYYLPHASNAGEER